MRNGLIAAAGFALLAPTALAAVQSNIAHTAQPWETLSSIAARYSTTVQAIASANGIVNVNRVDIGQRLFISTVVHPPGSALRGTTFYAVWARRHASEHCPAFWHNSERDQCCQRHFQPERDFRGAAAGDPDPISQSRCGRAGPLALPAVR